MHSLSLVMVMLANAMCSSAVLVTRNSANRMRNQPNMLVPPPRSTFLRTEDRKCNISDPVAQAAYDWCTQNGAVVQLTAHDGKTLKMWVFNTTGANTVVAYLNPSFSFIHLGCELAMDFVTRGGASVVIMNWRGWGFQPRHGDAERGQSVVHQESYENHYLDLDLMLAKAFQGHKRLLFMSQSAGSVVAARYLQAHWDGSTPISKSIFVVPAFRMKNKIPDWIGFVIAKSASRVLGGDAIARLAGQKYYTDDEYQENVVKWCRRGGNYSNIRCDAISDLISCYPKAITGGVSYEWIATQIWQGWSAIWDASKITIPVTIVQAGYDTISDNTAQDSFCTGAVDCEMIKTNAAHWVLSEIDENRNQAMDPLIKLC